MSCSVSLCFISLREVLLLKPDVGWWPYHHCSCLHHPHTMLGFQVWMATPKFLYGCWDTDSDSPVRTASPLPHGATSQAPAGPVLCFLLDERLPEFWLWAIWNCVCSYKLNELFIKAWDFPSFAYWSLLFSRVVRSFSCIVYNQTNTVKIKSKVVLKKAKLWALAGVTGCVWSGWSSTERRRHFFIHHEDFFNTLT